MTDALLVDANGKPITEAADVSELFVVCKQGVPIAVAKSERTVRDILSQHEPRTVRVFRVPMDWR